MTKAEARSALTELLEYECEQCQDYLEEQCVHCPYSYDDGERCVIEDVQNYLAQRTMVRSKE